MAHVLKRRDQEAVRWYVLTLPTAGGGRDRISPSKGLDAELSRRERRGEALFEYFSPSYVEARKVGGKMVNTKRPLLYNYVFVHASEDEIFRLKRTLPLYNFLPRVSSGGRSYFPYLSDRETPKPSSAASDVYKRQWIPCVGSRLLTPTSFRCTCQIAAAC